MPTISNADGEKSLESLVYITSKGIDDVWKALKLLFYAEKIHMQKYGQPITGDYFVAMREGPVPSFAYDIVKSAQSKKKSINPIADELNPELSLRTVGNTRIKAIREPDLNVLSESAIEALDEAIEIYGPLSYSELSKIAHAESCYKSTKLNSEISMEDYLSWLDLSPEMLEYITS